MNSYNLSKTVTVQKSVIKICLIDTRTLKITDLLILIEVLHFVFILSIFIPL